MCSRSESAKCVVAMTWCNAVIENYLKEETNSKVDWKKLMEIQAALFYGAQACMKKSVSDSGVRTVKRIWKKVCSSVFGKVLIGFVNFHSDSYVPRIFN